MLYCGVEQDDWVSTYNVFWEAAKRVGIKKIGERTTLLWKLSEKKGEGVTYFDGSLNGEVENREHQFKDLLEVWAASPADALICKVKAKAKGRAEGSWRYCSLEDHEVDPLYMQEEALVR